MKSSKRILGVVLALIMIFNVFAVGAFAAFPDDAAVKLTLSTDKTTYAPGDEIVVTVYQQAIAELGGMTPAGSYEIAYDSSAIAPYSTSEDLVSGHGLVVNSEVSAGFDNSMSKYMSGAAGVDAKYNWDASACYAVAGITGVGIYQCTDAPYAVFTVKMKVADDAADGTYTIGFNKIAYDSYMAFSVSGTYDALYGNDASAYGLSVPYFYDLGTCEIKVSSAPAVTVESKGTMAHMNNWEDTEATTYTAGLVGQINGLALTFNETTGECNEIKEIKVTIEGSEQVGYAYKVYKVNDTTYQFRAILLDAPKTGTTALKYTFHVKLADDTVVTCSDETTAKAIFDTAYAKYQAANP